MKYVYYCRNSKGEYLCHRKWYSSTRIGPREKARVYKRQCDATSSLKWSRLDSDWYVVKCMVGSEERI